MRGFPQLKPSTRWLLGGVVIFAWFLGAPLTPFASAYFSIVAPGLHLVLFLVAMGALMAVSRCASCGYPVWLRKLKGGGYLIGGPGRDCSRCGGPV